MITDDRLAGHGCHPSKNALGVHSNKRPAEPGEKKTPLLSPFWFLYLGESAFGGSAWSVGTSAGVRAPPTREAKNAYPRPWRASRATRTKPGAVVFRATCHLEEHFARSGLRQRADLRFDALAVRGYPCIAVNHPHIMAVTYAKESPFRINGLGFFCISLELCIKRPLHGGKFSLTVTLPINV